MPDTRPGVRFDENGVCYPCLTAKKKKEIDWEKRKKELEALCTKYRGARGDYYDCLIAVSGGKDSHFQTYMMKEVMGMNPLLVSVDNFTWTSAGRHNFYNIRDAFGCDCISLNLSPRTAKKMFKIAFENFGAPTWYWDRAVYVYPIRMAINLGIPLVIYGENINFEYGGGQIKDIPSARDQINNDVAKTFDWSTWLKHGLSMKDLNFCIYPDEKEIARAGLDPIYLSYFTPWDGFKNMEIAKKYGFRSLGEEWKREGYIEDYDQIDAIGYLVHCWMKFPKFGHSRATDVSCYWIRTGRLSRAEAVELVIEHDYKLDPRAKEDFMSFCGYEEGQFNEIVDSFANREILAKKNGVWKLKDEVVQLLRDPK
jgi:N-acetyl sugar amidotransferase